jgi:hypothetical protein
MNENMSRGVERLLSDMRKPHTLSWETKKGMLREASPFSFTDGDAA